MGTPDSIVLALIVDDLLELSIPERGRVISFRSNFSTDVYSVFRWSN